MPEIAEESGFPLPCAPDGREGGKKEVLELEERPMAGGEKMPRPKRLKRLKNDHARLRSPAPPPTASYLLPSDARHQHRRGKPFHVEPADHHTNDEAVRGPHKALLHKDVIAVPAHGARVDVKALPNTECPAVASAGGIHHHGASQGLEVLQDPLLAEKVGTGNISLTQVAGIVHVPHEVQVNGQHHTVEDVTFQDVLDGLFSVFIVEVRQPHSHQEPGIYVPNQEQENEGHPTEPKNHLDELEKQPARLLSGGSSVSRADSTDSDLRLSTALDHIRQPAPVFGTSQFHQKRCLEAACLCTAP